MLLYKIEIILAVIWFYFDDISCSFKNHRKALTFTTYLIFLKGTIFQTNSTVIFIFLTYTRNRKESF